jgi:hypothetical protein
MSDDTLLDLRVREALRELPLPEGPETQEALRDVMERADRGARAQWLWTGAVAASLVLVVVLLAVLGLPSSPTGRHHPAPAGQRTGTGAGAYEGIYVHRVGGAVDRTWNGSWLVSLVPGWWGVPAGPRGDMKVSSPAGARHVGDGEEAVFEVSGHRMLISAFDQDVCRGRPPGSYTWSVADALLTLVPVRDACLQRRRVFAGVWDRIGGVSQGLPGPPRRVS